MVIYTINEMLEILACTIIYLALVLFLLKSEDIFDVDHFIDYLKDDVQIVPDIPSWFTNKSELFMSISGMFPLILLSGNLNFKPICNAVAVAKIMNATLILPVLKQDQIWKDQTNFEDIFDADHFIDYLKDDVQIVPDIPSWFTNKRTVKNIPKYAPTQFYIDNVLPRIKEKKIMAFKPFVDRLGYDNVPQEIDWLRCRVNYQALKFFPEIDEMANRLVERMRNRTDSPKPFIYKEEVVAVLVLFDVNPDIRFQDAIKLFSMQLITSTLAARNRMKDVELMRMRYAIESVVLALGAIGNNKNN
ncbi:GDP-fucose protein O-fucosyltransferase [Tanacetum coccineum]|uniref:O-fucosyltransferase family protein n=1 Tax=Tanacetum coccineum TaxID=301880 RepID=A0ABQ5ELL4_9ASTR